MSYWSILGINKTSDHKIIKKAYAKALKIYHPEKDPTGFQALREAYDKALRHADKAVITFENSLDNNATKNGNIHQLGDADAFPFFENNSDNEIDKSLGFPDAPQGSNLFSSNALALDDWESKTHALFKEFENLYADFYTRINTHKWANLLNSALFWDINHHKELSIKVQHFILNHNLLPPNIVRLFNQHFNWFSSDSNSHIIGKLNKGLSIYFEMMPPFYYMEVATTESVDWDIYYQHILKAYYALYQEKASAAATHIQMAQKIFQEGLDLKVLKAFYHTRVELFKKNSIDLPILNPTESNRSEVLYFIGYIYGQHASYKEALEYFQYAYQINPLHHKAIHFALVCLKRLTFNMNKIDYLIEIFELEPENPQLLQLIQIQLDIERKAHKKDPNNSKVKEDYTRLLQMLGRTYEPPYYQMNIPKKHNYLSQPIKILNRSLEKYYYFSIKSKKYTTGIKRIIVTIKNSYFLSTVILLSLLVLILYGYVLFIQYRASHLSEKDIVPYLEKRYATMTSTTEPEAMKTFYQYIFIQDYNFIDEPASLLYMGNNKYMINYLYSKDEYQSMSTQLSTNFGAILYPLREKNLSDLDYIEAVYTFISTNCTLSSLDQDLRSLEHIMTNLYPKQPTLFSPYGPMVRKDGTSHAIAQTFSMFMGAENIKCRVVSGTLNGKLHFWNKVKLNNEWYVVDIALKLENDYNLDIAYMRTDAEAPFLIPDDHWSSDQVIRSIESSGTSPYEYYKSNNLYAKTEFEVGSIFARNELVFRVDPTMSDDVLVNIYSNFKYISGKKVKYQRFFDVIVVEP